jgi:hypothetical protein
MTIKDLNVTRNEDKIYKLHVFDKDGDIDLTGLTGLNIQFAIKAQPEDPDYLIHKDLGTVAKASKSILAGNAQLDYEAQNTGVEGNDISIEYVDPGSNNAALSVSLVTDVITRNNALVTNYNIKISLATDGGGATTSTANEVKAAIEANSDTNALVTITVPGTGADVVSAISQTYLEGGLSGGITLTIPTEGRFKVSIPQSEIFAIPDGTYVYDCLVNFGGGNRTVVLKGTIIFETGVSE